MNLGSLLTKLAFEYEYEWDGYLYRVRPPHPQLDAVYYHIAPEGAEFYQSVHGGEVERFGLPQAKNIMLIDFDYDGAPRKNKIGLETVGEWQPSESVDDDPAIMIENILPRLRHLGYDVVVINGETGAEVTGPPVEVVDLSQMQLGVQGVAETI